MCCFVVVFVVNSLNLHIFVCVRTLRFVVIRVVFLTRHLRVEGVGLKASELRAA